MIQIINSLENYLRQNNIKILLDSECTNIIKNNSIYRCTINNNYKFDTQNIIFAVTCNDLIKIPFLDQVNTKLNSVLSRPFTRIYLVFPLLDGKVWFDFIENTLTTPTLLNQLIPISKEKGILMIYVDGRNATTLNYYYEANILKTEIMFHLTKLFIDISIPEPINIYFKYHSNALHIWKQNTVPASLYNEIIHPINNENIFIVGESYSLNQQWCEGALQSVDNLMHVFNYNKSIEKSRIDN